MRYAKEQEIAVLKNDRDKWKETAELGHGMVIGMSQKKAPKVPMVIDSQAREVTPQTENYAQTSTLGQYVPNQQNMFV